MNAYLLDTNVLVHLANRADGWQLIDHHLQVLDNGRLNVSAITVWEISRMAEKAKVKKSAIDALLVMVRAFNVIPLTEQYAALSGSLHGFLSNKGKTIGERDSMIAGTAMALDLVVVTDNTSEFDRVPGLVVQNWRKAN